MSFKGKSMVTIGLEKTEVAQELRELAELVRYAMGL